MTTSRPEPIQRECKHHGLTIFVWYFNSHERKGGHWECKTCKAFKSTDRRRKMKRLLVEEAGGKCQVCDYDKCLWALQFHHLDRKEKKFEIGSKNNRSVAKLREEVKKCVLLCSNCHFEVEAGLVDLEALNVHPPELIRDAA